MAFSDNLSFLVALDPQQSDIPANARGDVVSLMRWNFDGAIPDEAIALLLSDPLLPHAVRMLATKMLAAAANDRAIDGIFKDAGRYIAAMSAIYLHASGGLTLPRLKAMCAASSLLSPGRARALLSYMRYLGYIAPFPIEQRAEPAHYMPTARLITAWQGHLRAALDAAYILEPAVGLVRDRLNDPDVLTTFSRIQIEGLMLSGQVNDIAPTFVRIFLQRHAGTQIVWSLLAAEDDAFPPRQPIRLSIAATARRFNVSRIHIRRLLDEADRNGLLRRGEDGTIHLEEAARAALRFIYPVQLIRLLSAAAKTIVERPDLIAR